MFTSTDLYADPSAADVTDGSSSIWSDLVSQIGSLANAGAVAYASSQGQSASIAPSGSITTIPSGVFLTNPAAPKTTSALGGLASDPVVWGIGALVLLLLVMKK